MVFKWYGEEIKKKMDKAVPLAIDYVLSNSVRVAKRLVPVKTGTAQGSIQMRNATKDVRGWFGQWGSYNCAYFIFLERGTVKMKKRPSLIPSADINYPILSGKIIEAYKSL